MDPSRPSGQYEQASFLPYYAQKAKIPVAWGDPPRSGAVIRFARPAGANPDGSPDDGPGGNILLLGQISGIVFILGMNALKAPSTGAMTASLLILAGLAVISVVLAAMIRESPVHKGRLQDRPL